MNKDKVIDFTEFFDLLDDDYLNEVFIDDNYMTTENLEDIIKSCINSINKLNIDDTTPLEYDSIVDIVVNVAETSVAGVRPVGNKLYQLIIAKAALRTDKADYLLTAIYHELCHILQFNYAFDNNYIYFDPMDDKVKIKNEELFNGTIKKNNGHTFIWWSYVHEVNSHINLKIPVADTLCRDMLVKLFLESTFSDGIVDSDIFIKNNWL